MMKGKKNNYEMFNCCLNHLAAIFMRVASFSYFTLMVTKMILTFNSK